MDIAPPRSLRLGVAAVVLLFAALALTELGRYRSINGDETYYMEAAWNMLRSGDWLIPRYADGALRFEKPIATYWAVGACTWVFGFSLWATRLHSVLFSLATLPYVYLLGRATLKDRTKALLGVAVYASIKSVQANAHQGRTDAILSFFVAAAMAHFANALLASDLPRRDSALGHAFTAGAVLTKGMAGMLYTYLPVAVFALIARKRLEPGRIRSLFAPLGLATFALLALPWFGYALATHPREFLDVFWHDQVSANLGSERPFFVSSFVSYVWLFLRESFPWWPVLLIACLIDRATLVRTLRERRTVWLFLGTWIVVAVLVMSCANTTRGRYLLPTLPGLAVLMAALLIESGEAGRMKKVVQWGIHAMTAASIGLGALLVAMEMGVIEPSDMTWVAAPTIALVLVALALSLSARRLDLGTAACAFAALSLALIECGTALWQEPAPLVPMAELGRERVAAAPETTRVTIVSPYAKELATALLMSSGRRPADASVIREPKRQLQRVQAFLREDGPRWLVLEDRTYSQLPEQVRARLEVVDERSGLLQRGLRESVARKLPGRLGQFLAQFDTLRVLAPLEPSR